jgi:hypothetical protein
MIFARKDRPKRQVFLTNRELLQVANNDRDS